MNSSSLLLVIVLAWGVNLLGGLLQAAADDRHRPLPVGAKRGVSVMPNLVMVLAAWGLATLLDLLVAPWGTLLVASGHGAFILYMLPSLLRSTRRLRSRHGPK
jgi:uncharacterized protein (DUF486 family)